MFWRMTTFAAILLCAMLAEAKERVWTSADGRTMNAEFVRELDGDVTFRKDGKLVVIRVEKLSEKDQQAVKDLAADGDQEYVREILTSQGKEDQIPSNTPPARGGGEIGGGGIAGAGGIGGTRIPVGIPGGIPGGALPPGIAPGGGIGGRAPRSGMVGGGMGGPMGGAGMPAGIGGAPGIPRGAGPPSGIMPAGGGAPTGSGGFPPGMAEMPGVGGTRPPGMAGPAMTPPPIGGAGMSPAGMTLPGMGSAGIGGSGTSSMPGSSFPGMGPASIPAIPDPTFSTPTFEQIYSCSSCGARISQAEVSLSKCPHCGITWGYKLDQFGNKTMTSAGGNLATVGIVIVIFVLLGVIVFIALFVGIIVAIVKATSAPARPPQPQRYY